MIGPANNSSKVTTNDATILAQHPCYILQQNQRKLRGIASELVQCKIVHIQTCTSQPFQAVDKIHSPVGLLFRPCRIYPPGPLQLRIAILKSV